MNILQKAGALITSERFLTSFLSSLAFSLALLFFAPLEMLFRSYFSFYFTAQDLLPLFLGLSLALCLVCLLTLMLLPEGARRTCAVVLVALAVLIWLQGNIIVWRYSALDGSIMDLSKNPVRGIVDLAIWATVLCTAVLLRGSLYRSIRTVVVVLLLIFFTNSLYLYLSLPVDPSYKKYEAGFGGEFDFSDKSNIIIVILDKFQSDVFNEIVSERPERGKSFDGFTYFRNATASYAYTYGAITTLLTSRLYGNTVQLQSFMKNAYYSPSSIPRVLSKNGYDVELYPCRLEYLPGLEKVYYFDPKIVSNIMERDKRALASSYDVWFLVDLSLFRIVPHFAKRWIYRQGIWLFSFRAFRKDLRDKARDAAVRGAAYDEKVLESYDFRFMIAMQRKTALKKKSDTFKLIHLQGPHLPLVLNEDLKVSSSETVSGRYRDQAAASLRIMDRFLAKLKEIGAYDNSMIFIIGDHGAGNYLGGIKYKTAGVIDRGSSDGGFMGRIASGLPLVLVKRRGERGAMKTSDAPVSLQDIPPTICAAVRLTCDSEGRDIFSIKDSERRKRTFYWFESHGIRHWNERYLPPLHEYTIDGFSWDPASWKKTGRVLTAPD